jgi:L-asparaginase/Glu-tRNA(Gln) amidotransferase subunit D
MRKSLLKQTRVLLQKRFSLWNEPGKALAGCGRRSPCRISTALPNGRAYAKVYARSFANHFDQEVVDYNKLMGKSLQPAVGRLVNEDEAHSTYIPEVMLHDRDGRQRPKILILCLGGTLTMAKSEKHGGALAPVEGALSRYMEGMDELHNKGKNNMPDYVLHEYAPFYDSSDLGPADWARVAHDIKDNYYLFDGFVVITGTDTMAYFATALSFMLENLGKPVVFTGSQIPLSEPYNDGRRNLIMALIFASR